MAMLSIFNVKKKNKPPLLKFTISVFLLFRDFFNKGLSVEAASLSFNTLLTIVPIAILSFIGISNFSNSLVLWNKLQSVISTIFIPEAANEAIKTIFSIIEKIKHISFISVLALSLTCWCLVHNISRAFRKIWKNKPDKFTTKNIFTYLILLILTPISIGIIFVSIAWIISLQLFSSLMLYSNYILNIFMVGVSYLILFQIFLLLNLIMPHCKVPFKEACIGSCITVIIFEGVKNVFVLYVSYFGTYHVIYGAMAAFPIFLLWIYLIWLTVLFGGFVTYTLTQRKRRVKNCKKIQRA